jgi:hypothetical protein
MATVIRGSARIAEDGHVSRQLAWAAAVTLVVLTVGALAAAATAVSYASTAREQRAHATVWRVDGADRSAIADRDTVKTPAVGEGLLAPESLADSDHGPSH